MMESNFESGLLSFRLSLLFAFALRIVLGKICHCIAMGYLNHFDLNITLLN